MFRVYNKKEKRMYYHNNTFEKNRYFLSQKGELIEVKVAPSLSVAIYFETNPKDCVLMLGTNINDKDVYEQDIIDISSFGYAQGITHYNVSSIETFLQEIGYNNKWEHEKWFIIGNFWEQYDKVEKKLEKK